MTWKKYGKKCAGFSLCKIINDSDEYIAASFRYETNYMFANEQRAKKKKERTKKHLEILKSIPRARILFYSILVWMRDVVTTLGWMCSASTTNTFTLFAIRVFCSLRFAVSCVGECVCVCNRVHTMIMRIVSNILFSQWLTVSHNGWLVQHLFFCFRHRLRSRIMILTKTGSELSDRNSRRGMLGWKWNNNNNWTRAMAGEGQRRTHGK